MSAASPSPLPPPTTPHTYLCRSCTTTISDSLHLSSLLRPLSVLILTGTVNTTLSATPHTAASGAPDEFCVYRLISCTRCAGELGRYYLAVTAGLEPLRERFAVALDRVDVYVLGAGVRAGESVREELDIVRPKPEVVVWRVNQVMSSVVMLQEELEAVGARVAGVEALGERLAALEREVRELRVGTREEAAGRGRKRKGLESEENDSEASTQETGKTEGAAREERRETKAPGRRQSRRKSDVGEGDAGGEEKSVGPKNATLPTGRRKPRGRNNN